MEKKGKKKFFRKGKFSKISHKVKEQTLNPNVEFKKELFKDEERPFKVDDDDYRDRAKERRREINYNDSEEFIEENTVKSKYNSIIAYEYHPGLDKELFRKAKEEIEKQQQTQKSISVQPTQYESIKSPLFINEKNKGKIYNSAIGSKVFHYLRENRYSKVREPKKIDSFFEYDLKNPDLPLIIKKNTQNWNNEFMVRVDISDKMLEKLEECLTRKKRRDKPKEKKEEIKCLLQETTTRMVAVDDEEEIFPELKKNNKEFKNIELKKNKVEQDEDDIFKYKEISLSELLKKKK